MMNFKKLPILLLPALLLASSCKEDAEPPVSGEEAVITLVTSYYGSGDMGYNDLILDGVCRAASASGSTLSLFRPDSDEALREYARQWLASPATQTRILIFSSADQAKLLSSMSEPDAHHRVLTVDGHGAPDIPWWCGSIDIDRYGAAYLAGCMAADNRSPLIVAARPDDPTLIPAIDGFSDGYASLNSGSRPRVAYLADDESGYSSATEAYRLMSEAEEVSFVFPLAGGSCSGIYKYLRENEFTLMLACGMDVDCAGIAPRLPFSLTVAVDRALEERIISMLRGEDAEAEEKAYGLESGYTDIAADPDFYESLLTWEDYYDAPDYWIGRRSLYLQAAIDAERRYRK